MQHRLYKICRYLSVVAVMLSVTACSAIKLSYNNAPDLLYWWLDSYVNFNATQKPVIKQDLQALHSWHRQHELPLYIKLLESLQSMSGTDTDSQKVCNVVNEIQHRYQTLTLQFQPIAAKLAPTLTPDQLTHMRKHFDRNNEKWREEWLEGSRAEREKKRLKLAVERSEKLYGRLTQAQRELLLENIRQSNFDPAISDAHRVRLQQDALSGLAHIITLDDDAADIEMAVAAFFERMHKSDDTAYRSYAEKMTRHACEGMARFHNSTTPAQRQHAKEKLGGYLKDLEALKASAQIDRAI